VAEAQRLGRSLLWSGLGHAVLVGALMFVPGWNARGELWGGTGEAGAVQVTLVGALPAIPLPAPEVATSSRVVDVTRGLYQSEKPRPPEPDATELPQFERQRRLPKSPPSRLLENPAQPPPNAIPYGQGGTPQSLSSSFLLGEHSSAGLGFSGSGGSFGQRFPWYVDAVRRRISNNWLQSTIEPTLMWAPRVVVQFEILRDGTVANLRLVQSSGYPSVDASALRAVAQSSPLMPLPNEYSGRYVTVEFWFDFRR
jgi:protein TonB